MGSIWRRRGPDGKPHGPYLISWVDARGKQHTKSTRDRTRPGSGYNHDAAKRELAAIEGDVSRGAPVTAATGTRPFSAALEDVLADQRANERRSIADTERRIVLHIRPFFEGLRIGQITATEIRAFTAKRKAEGAKPAGVNRELAVIRRALRLAHRAGHILTLPHVALLDESRNVRQGFITPADLARLLKALGPTVHADIVEMAFVTGWRWQSELLPLRWGQIDFAAGRIRIDVGQTKGGEGRTFPLTARLRTILEARRPAKPAPAALVFTEDGAAINPTHFYKAWHAACEAADLVGRIPHDLRRSGVREMERRRIPRQVAMKLVGHRTESIYRRYAIVDETDIADAGARLDADMSTADVLQSQTGARKRQPKKRRKR